MKSILWGMAVIVSLVSSLGQAEILFVHHFDNTAGTTVLDRLEADLGLGGTEVTSLTSQDDARPDLVTNIVKFGSAAVQMAWDANNGQTLQMLYGARGNVDPNQGSFECWLYAMGWQNRHYSVFQVNDPNNTLLVVNDGDSATRGKFEYRVRTAGGVESAFLSTNVMPKNSWVHLAIDWKLDSTNSSENFVRAWMNGIKEIDVVGFSETTMNLTESSNMALFSRTGTARADDAWLGNGDDVRITNMLISDLYTLDGSGGFTPPATAWTFCGDPEHPYPIGDLDMNCEVDLGDFGILASHWLECTSPECD